MMLARRLPSDCLATSSKPSPSRLLGAALSRQVLLPLGLRSAPGYSRPPVLPPNSPLPCKHSSSGHQIAQDERRAAKSRNRLPTLPRTRRTSATELMELYVLILGSDVIIDGSLSDLSPLSSPSFSRFCRSRSVSLFNPHQAPSCESQKIEESRPMLTTRRRA